MKYGSVPDNPIWNIRFARHPDKKWMTGMITEAEEMKDADYPELRLFRVEHQLAPRR